MSLLNEIDRLREEAARIAKVSREDGAPEVTDMLRGRLAEVEDQIEKLLAEYIALPECPFRPCPGRLGPRATAGVLECSVCKTLALRGGYQAVSLVERIVHGA